MLPEIPRPTWQVPRLPGGQNMAVALKVAPVPWSGAANVGNVPKPMVFVLLTSDISDQSVIMGR
jgi:hypothetical protein